jgi:ubiquinone/menaquinone biosynthesis C-methylase UbiE
MMIHSSRRTISFPQQADELSIELSHKRKFYEKVAETKGDADDYWSSGFYQALLIKKINEILRGIRHQRIIDVGCGDGRTALYLTKGRNTTIGVDISHKRLSRARHKTGPDKKNALFVQAYAEILPLKDESFDGAICTEVLEHVLADDALLSGLSRVLKPRAWVLMSIPTVSLGRYFDMRYTKQLIYYDPIEHLREYTYHTIPPFEKDFILVKDLLRKLRSFGFITAKRYGVGFELPLGVRRFKIGSFLEGVLRNGKINTFISDVPFLRDFVVYTIFMLHKIPQIPQQSV